MAQQQMANRQLVLPALGLAWSITDTAEMKFTRAMPPG
jgi:hypothetical protein